DDIEQCLEVSGVVTGSRAGPTASPLSTSTNQGVVLTGTLPVATDPNSTTFTYAVGTAPTNGSVTVTPTGSFTYTPAATFFGTDNIANASSRATQERAPQ